MIRSWDKKGIWNGGVNKGVGSLGSHVACEYMLVISLYRVIGRVRMMTLHLGVTNGRSGTTSRTWDHLHDMLAKISCPGDLGGGISAQLCIYVFGSVWIVVYDMGGCHMCVVIDPDRDQLNLQLCINIVMFF